jgi:hypothetical protein
MVLCSDQSGLADEFDLRHAHAVALPVVEPPRRDRVRRRDDADERLAERVAPRAHGAHVAAARREPAHRVRVHEADDVPALLLAAQRPRAVGGDGRHLAAPEAESPAAPRAGAAGAA